jgi:hypothetical protein
MSWPLFSAFMQRAFPEATVERLDISDHFEVTILVDERDVRGRNAQALRDIHRKLTPRVVTRRRLHWGPSKWGRR